MEHVINNSDLVLTTDNVHNYTFNLDTATDMLKLTHSGDPDNQGRVGDWVYHEANLYQGDSYKPYSSNTATATRLGEAFRDIHNMQQFVYDVNGDLTRYIKDTYNSTLKVYQDIKNGLSHETLESDNGLYRTIENTITGEMNRQISEPTLFSQSVAGITEGRLDILSNNLSLGLFGEEGMISGLGVTTEGTTIKGSLIKLDGDVVAEKAFIENLNTKFLTSLEMIAERGYFGEMIANYINVNYLAGNHMEFISGAFVSHRGVLTLDGDHIKIDSNYDWDIELDNEGLSINNQTGRKMGFLGGIELYMSGVSSGTRYGVGLIAPPGMFAGLAYGTSSHSSTALSVNGSTGESYMHTDMVIWNGSSFMIGNTGQGFKFRNTRNGEELYSVSNGTSIRFERGDIYGVIGDTRYGFKYISDAIRNLQSQINSLARRG